MLATKIKTYSKIKVNQLYLKLLKYHINENWGLTTGFQDMEAGGDGDNWETVARNSFRLVFLEGEHNSRVVVIKENGDGDYYFIIFIFLGIYM